VHAIQSDIAESRWHVPVLNTSQYSSDAHWLSRRQALPTNADAGVDIIAGTKNENATRTACSVVNKRWFKNNIMERQNVAEKWEKFNSKYAEKKPPFRFGSHFSFLCQVL